jgi:hypothetical protein
LFEGTDSGGKSIQANEIQIVNGLQTTESIFRHFQHTTSPSDDRCVLVKVIITKDDAIRDAIIRATNNQTDVEIASLHATDKIQRDIEDVLLRHGLFYERRKNFYANQGHSPAELVTPLYAAAGYVALVLRKPHTAASLRSKFMRAPSSYEAVFNEAMPLEVWPKVVHILKRVDAELESLRPRAKVTDKFLKGWRYITAFLLLAQHFGKFTYSARELVGFDVSLITPKEVERIWRELNRQSSTNSPMGGWTTLRNVITACEEVARVYGTEDVESLSIAPTLPAFTSRQLAPSKPLTDDFIESVKALLPPQPWKPGINRKITNQLKCENTEYFAAVEKLIEDGLFLRQRDGVLYDTEGNVVSFDSERVDPDTLELRTAKA